MSVTGHNPVRQKDDFYATPAWCVKAVLPHLQFTARKVIDPCCGDGAILRVLRDELSARTELRGIELDEGRAIACQEAGFRVDCGDALAWNWLEPDLVITNPPFSLSMEFVLESFKQASRGATVAMLMRLPWLSSLKRAKWLRRHTPSVFVLPKRPSFTGKGTDATDYAWMVWSRVNGTIGVTDVPVVKILDIGESP